MDHLSTILQFVLHVTIRLKGFSYPMFEGVIYVVIHIIVLNFVYKVNCYVAMYLICQDLPCTHTMIKLSIHHQSIVSSISQQTNSIPLN